MNKSTLMFIVFYILNSQSLNNKCSTNASILFFSKNPAFRNESVPSIHLKEPVQRVGSFAKDTFLMESNERTKKLNSDILGLLMTLLASLFPSNDVMFPYTA